MQTCRHRLIREENCERDLWSAVLHRALMDCKYTTNAWGTSGDECHRQDAITWIFKKGSKDREGTFDWVCHHLDLDAEVVRNLVRKGIEQ